MEMVGCVGDVRVLGGSTNSHERDRGVQVRERLISGARDPDKLK